MNKTWKSVGLLTGLTAVAFSTATAGELDSRMENIVRQFVEVCKGKVEAEATLAVFPFQTDEKLAKKKVDYAVGELLTHKLLQGSKFKLVERAQLLTVLEELTLSMSGVIESETAAKVGELLGARLAVLGGVSRLGKSYQIVAKLVDIQSGQILASEVQEVSIQVFDEEAAAYLVLVPERQAIGLYLAYARGFISVSEVRPQTNFGVTVTPTNPPGTHGSKVPGIGVRYFPIQNWMLDLAIMWEVDSFLGDRYGSDSVFTVSGGQLMSNTIPTVEVKGVASRVIFNRVWRSLTRFRIFTGVGVSHFMPQKPDPQAAIWRKMDDVTVVSVGHLKAHLTNKGLTPLVRLGLEWKPQARFGWAVFGSYLSASDYRLTATMTRQKTGSNAVTGTVDDITVYQHNSRFSVETSLSLYF
ncbi:MAG: CsgG/HfaB family protein [Candidatus Latescibacter sp.]|nr:CsgG/HfaB family protein [Candidatus Latescibacter sp.]